MKKVKKGQILIIKKLKKFLSIYFFLKKRIILVTFFHKKSVSKYVFLLFQKNKNSTSNTLFKKKDTSKIFDFQFSYRINLWVVWVGLFWLNMESIEAKLWAWVFFLTKSEFFSEFTKNFKSIPIHSSFFCHKT